MRERLYSGFLVYDLKQTPEDFQVEEIIDPTWLTKTGRWTIFRLRKKGWNTIDALLRIARESKLQLSQIGYAGKKDRHAETLQFISCELPLQVPKELSSVLKLETVGRCERPLSPEANFGNRFRLTLRNLQEKEFPLLEENIGTVSRIGFVNYYDSQRFSRFHPEFRLPILQYFRKEYELCLRLFLTETFAGEKKQARDRKKKLQAEWGNWPLCEKLSGTKLEAGIFSALKRERNISPETFAKRMESFPEEELLMALSSFQSLLWNEFVSGLLFQEAESGVFIKTKTGPLFFPPDSLLSAVGLDRNIQVPGYPGIKNLEYSKNEMSMLDSVLSSWDLDSNCMDRSPFPKIRMHAFDRRLRVVPDDFETGKLEEDELNPGRKKMLLSFRLPAGTYATMLVKRLLLRAKPEHKKTQSDFGLISTP
ncbi:tRNA pseudouridine(13) synthase TruD [Leptospira gomenensis]|uniref:tRNA pseudouridine(13) synthase TruD n=1 Tax=Leptospira gomenensis TaxID=2484974 RepID=UPI003CCFEBBC